MVSSQLSGLTKNPISKPNQTQFLFSKNPTDSLVSDHVELDFSDVFGPVSVQAPIEVIHDDLDLSISVEESNELVYNDPVVIHNRSHSLVGPSSYVSQSLKLSKLAIHEPEDVEELAELVTKRKEPSFGSSVAEESALEVDGDFVIVETVGIEDFEVLKVVGQGAFAKVYQVRKKGTSEIYAMKVMRKDKIMEKNHAEYMKAERNILTIIDHPFIVQLRYSFQVITTVSISFESIILYKISYIKPFWK